MVYADPTTLTFGRETYMTLKTGTVVMIRPFRNRSSQSLEFSPSEIPTTDENYRLDVNGQTYNCHVIDSKNGEWTLAYGLRPDDESSTLFRLRGGTVDYSVAATRPIAGSVANDGTMAAIVHDESNTKAVGLKVVVGDRVTVDRELESTISDIAVRPDGDVVAVATRPPDERVYTFDTLTGEQLWEYTLPWETPNMLGYHGDEDLLLIAREPREEPYVALDTDGEVEWGCDRYLSQRPFRKRVKEWFDRN